MKLQLNEIKETLSKLFVSYGISKSDAELIYQSMIYSDLRGYPNHGISRVNQLVEGLDSKCVSPIDISKVINEQRAVTIYDGDGSIGQVVGTKAVLKTIEKAKEFGIAYCGVVNTSHIGALSYYADLAANHGMFCLVMSTSSPAVAVPGSKYKILGTNPIAYSFPTKTYNLTGDFSTSKVSRGTVIEMNEKGLEFSSLSGVDKDGNPTRKPSEILEGALITLDDGYKGALISLLVSILAGPMIGGVNNYDVAGTRYMDEKPNKGDFFLIIDIHKSTNYDNFLTKMEELKDYIISVGDTFRVPGERGCRTLLKSSKDGIEIPDNLLKLLKQNKLID